MPSRLSSLLVRDGLVGVKRMEKAFQRQVIYGGSLDTILLEMGLVPEERLTQYLALASGLPPAAREEGHVIDSAATAVIAREIAEQYRAVPVAFEGEALRLLVCAPLEITELEDLADLIDRPLQPLITPEYRWHLAYSAAYSLDPPARFTTLARSLDVDSTTAPVGRARSIIVDDSTVSRGIPSAPITDELTEPTTIPHEVEPPPPRRVSPIEPIAPDAHTMKISELPVSRSDPREPTHDPSTRAKHGTLMGLRPNRAHTEAGIIQPARKPATNPPVWAETEPDAIVVDLPPVEPTIPPKPAAQWGVPTGAPVTPVPAVSPVTRLSARIPNRPQTSPISTAGRDTPIAISKARELLATAEDRDTVFLTLLRVTRARAKWAGLLTVQGGAVIGRVALAEPGLDAQAVNSILIPLDAVSAFRTVIASHQPHIGPLVSGDPGIDSMILRMGGTMPPSALIMPIVLRERVIAVLVAHRSPSNLRVVDVTELLPLANVASDAIGRLIVKHKAAGYRAPATGIVTNELEAEIEIDTKRIITQRTPENWAVPEPQDRPALPDLTEPDADFSITTEPVRGIEALLDEIEAAREGSADDALADAVERSSETLGALMRRFPGKLRVDRFAVTGRPLRAAQYGGLLELVVRLGSVASELLIEKMSAPQRDVRFYATVCAAELRPRNAVFGLAERLFDQDFGVRATAIEALSGYPMQELGHALVRVRRAIHSTDPEVVAAATAAIVELGDVEALTDLMGAVERTDRGGDHARRALVTLTAQDFGPSERKWRKWWDGAKQRHRIEWLIDGLLHKEDPIREVAINDLRRLTGEYFGYHHDLPKKEREAAAGRWAAWWRETGQRRFEAREQPPDERRRPTALLPARREP